MAASTHPETRTRADSDGAGRSRHHDRYDRYERHQKHEMHDRHSGHGSHHHAGHRHGTRDEDERPGRHGHRHHREDEHRGGRRHDGHDDSYKRRRLDKSLEDREGHDRARSRDRHTGRHSDRHADRHAERHTDKDRHRERHGQDRHRHTNRDRPRHHSHDDPRHTPSNDAEALYTTDTRGDPLIRQYGTNDRANVPVYYRLYNGRTVLGSDQRHVFRLDGIKELFFAEPRSYDTVGSVLSHGSHPLVRRIMLELDQPVGSMKGAVTEKPGAQDDTGATSQPADFVPVGSPRKRKRKRADAGSERGGSPSSSSASSSDSASDDDEPDEDSTINFVADHSALEAAKQKLAQLSRQIREQPEDVHAWLALADLQEDQARLLGSTGDETLAAVGLFAPDAEPQTAGPDAAISAVKISILESALRQVKLPADRDGLQLALLREAPKVWSRERISKRWADLTERNDASFAVWRARLDHEMTSLLSFNVDRLVAFCVKRLRLLERKAEATLPSADGSAEIMDLYAQMVYVFLRSTRLLYDAGFCDRATAAWQALLETTFARPALDVSDQPDSGSFEAFWDSELPRIGDDKAEGWRSFAEKARSDPSAVDMPLDGFGAVPCLTLPTVDVARITRNCRAEMGENADLDEYTPLYGAWAAAELQRSALAKLPGRITDEVDDDGYEDVFRVVMFSDIKDLLFTIRPTVLPALQPFLLDAFLLFCQLPPAFGFGTWIETARNDPFLAMICLSTGEDKSRDRTEDSAPTAAGGRQPPDFGCDGSQVAVTSDLLFPQPGWFQYLPRWLQSAEDNTTDSAPVPPRWAANVLRQLVRSWGVKDLARYSLAVDAAIDPAGLKKAARTLLKQYLSNTGLYDAYALAEASRGHVDVARSVLASATASSTQDVEAELSLRQTWAWMEMEAHEMHEALYRLVLSSSFGSGREEDRSSATQREAASQPMSPAQLLRARHALRTGMDYSLSAGEVSRAALFAQSYVLLEYLAAVPSAAEQGTRGDVGAALAAAALFSDELQARSHGASAAHERFLQGTARIVLFHACRGPYRPADLQAPLRRFVSLFPRNGLFLRLFASIDPAAASGLARLRPDDPLQQVLDTVVLVPGQDCPSSRAFVVRLALQQARQTGAGPGRHAARAAFARALGGSETNKRDRSNTLFQGSAQLWQAYVHLTVAEAMAAIVTVSATAAADGRGRRGRSGRREDHPRLVVTDKKLLALAKTLYYRAVRACPWSKAVYLEGFGALAAPPAMASAAATTASRWSLTAEELRAVVHQMTEMRLRLHVDPDAVYERARAMWEEQQKDTLRSKS